MKAVLAPSLHQIDEVRVGDNIVTHHTPVDMTHDEIDAANAALGSVQIVTVQVRDELAAAPAEEAGPDDLEGALKKEKEESNKKGGDK